MDKLKQFHIVVLYKQMNIWDKEKTEDFIILQRKCKSGQINYHKVTILTCSMTNAFCSSAHFNSASTFQQICYFKKGFLWKEAFIWHQENKLYSIYLCI